MTNHIVKPGRPRDPERNLVARWFDGTGMHIDELANALGISRPHAYKIRAGNRFPSMRAALKLEKLSEGKVTVEYWERRREEMRKAKEA